MAKDDYYVIVYKLLSYLYSCLKKGNSVDTKNLMEVIKVDVNSNYWDYIIRELYIDGYVEGVTTFKYIGDIDDRVKINSNFKIKPKGIDFLMNNSNMCKVKDFLREIKEILPWI